MREVKLNKHDQVRGLMYSSICPECKKTFEHASAEWGYTFQTKKYCTYSCMRAAERRAMKPKTKGEAECKD